MTFWLWTIYSFLYKKMFMLQFISKVTNLNNYWIAYQDTENLKRHMINIYNDSMFQANDSDDGGTFRLTCERRLTWDETWANRLLQLDDEIRSKDDERKFLSNSPEMATPEMSSKGCFLKFVGLGFRQLAPPLILLLFSIKKSKHATRWKRKNMYCPKFSSKNHF